MRSDDGDFRERGRHILAGSRKKRTTKKRTKKQSTYGKAFGLIAIAIVFALSCIVSITSLTPKRYEVSEGSVASETITAPRIVEDTVVTEALRQSARNNVDPVYSVDTSMADTLISGAQSFFSALKSFKNTAEDIKASTAPTITGADGETYASDDTREWEDIITSNDLLAMLVKLETKLRAGVSEEELDKTLSEINKELKVSTLSVWLKSLGETLYEAYLIPTNVVDTVETTRAQEKAAAEVETVYIARGSVIVEKGQTITDKQMEILLSLDLVKGAESASHLATGTIAYLFCIYAMMLLYLAAFERETFTSTKKMTILALILIFTLLLQWLCYVIDPRVSPAVFGVLLTCLLLSRHVAEVVNVTLALSMALLAGGSGSTLFGPDSILAMASMLVTGQATILVAERSEKRGALIASGTIGGIAGALTVGAGGIILEYSWNSTLIYAGLVMAAALILSVFCVGMLSVWENMFDIVTPARLHELANTNHPLLKKMMKTAPGTYHHSMMTASLAEGAAEDIGANALLARTGAMYHDVGKLRRPLYFKENQNGQNIHDTLPPEESAGFIIAHQKDAEAYLSRYRMPSAVRRIANEHHGTTLVAYFYYKAKQQQEVDGEPVIERLFRYQGNLPSSKESAIVMLADSCEAAVRSLNEPSREEIAEMIRRIVQGKIDDGQLKQAPLTLEELDKIERSFLHTFSGLMHERIRYPGMELPG
jgi:putative nucleotidyltransferase with HDIG domain